jgi:hypothetical protein
VLQQPLTRHELADLIEHYGGQLVNALRGCAPAHGKPDSQGTTVAADSSPVGAEPVQSRPSRAAGPDGPGGRTGPWRKVGELEGETYTWPEVTEHYKPFEVWETEDARGRVQIGLARPVERGIFYGSERGYLLAFEMVNGQKRRPIVVFNESDDHEQTGDLLGVIKGKGAGGRSMFAPGDELPADYDGMPVEVFKDRITGPQAFNRLAVVAKGGDRPTMLDHSLTQLRLRS